jgi:hypothetical protein
MAKLQKTGGVAALYLGAAYVVGMVYFLLVVDYPGVVDPIEKVALLEDNQVGMYVLHLVIYVVFGVFLAMLALALYERLKTTAPALMQTATAVGLIWACLLVGSGMVFNVGMMSVVDTYATDPAQAGPVWSAIESVSEGLSGNGEFIGGLWTLLVSWAALRTGGLPRVLNYLGLLVGVAGIISVVPALETVAAVFAIGQIVWFVWLGVVLLRGDSIPALREPDSSVA